MMSKNETLLGTAKVSKKHQLQLIREVRPHLNAPVDEAFEVEFILRDGEVILRRRGGGNT